MAENHIASDDAFAPEAATDEPVSPATTIYADGDWPDFASEAEAFASYKGMTHGIRISAPAVGYALMRG